jgi:glucose/arabinose dehydrogenase
MSLFFSVFLFAGAATFLQPQLAIREVVAGLDGTTTIASAGDSRLFITRQLGLIRIFKEGALLPAPFLDVSGKVSCCGEQGLLGLAFDPHFQENGRLFVDYTDAAGNTRIERYSVSASDPDRANPDSALLILEIHQPFANHNGGELQFGPDGFLYVGMGDGGSHGDPGNNAQNPSSLLGKILRIDVDSGSPYSIPLSNPFVSLLGARPEIWAWGLRNPWRFSFDRRDGDLWIGDVGQDSWEEIDLQPAASRGGENYGWRRMEGSHCFDPRTGCREASMTLPIFEYSHSEGCAITGGYRYRGSRYPRLYGLYLYADYCSGEIWGLAEEEDGTWTRHDLLKTTLSITTFGEDSGGELYLADQDGSLYSVVDAAPSRRRAIVR